MKEVKFPSGLEKIGTHSFADSGLEKIVFPASVKEIGPWAFYGCTHLKSVQLNEGLEKLGEIQVTD